MIDRISLRSLLFAATSVFLGFFYCMATAMAADITVTTESEFNAALAGADDPIVVAAGELRLTAALAAPARAYTLTGEVDQDGEPISVIVAADGQRILNVTANNPYNATGSLTSISNLVFTRAADGTAVSGNGGAVYIAGSITGGIDNVDFSNHTTASVTSGNEGRGSAIFVANGFTGNLSNSVFDSNHASGAGTVFVVGTFTGNVVNTTFSNNSADNSQFGFGGAGLVVNGSFTGNIEDSLFINNSATANRGGAVTVYTTNGGTFNGDITGSQFIGNTNTGDDEEERFGGAVFINGALNGKVVDSLFKDNVVDNGHGGGIYAASILNGVHNSTFKNNSARYGGAIATLNGSIGGIVDSLFKGNTATTQGGAIYSVGGITGGITKSRFINNSSGAAGGAIITVGLSGGIKNSLFSGNSSGGQGGAISFAGSSTLSGGITGSKFINNTARESGAAIFGYNIVGDITDSEFDSNATDATGTIYISNTFVGDIISTTFSNNTAANASETGAGGAGIVIIGGMTGSIVDSTFEKNVGGSMIGGAVALYTGNLISIVDSNFTYNQLGASTSTSAPSRGGAVAVYGYSSGGSITNGISRSTFTYNSIAGELSEGGAIWARNINGITDSEFAYNSANTGGAICVADTISGGIVNTSFTGNSAQNGGAIYAVYGISGDIVDTPFTDNVATVSGGALYLPSGALSLVNPEFLRNTAETGRGGAIFTGGTVAITVTSGDTGLFSGNTASGSSNAIRFNGSGGLSVDVAAGGLLDMRDAVSGVTALGTEIAIIKTGEGTWALGGDTTFTETYLGGATTFSVLEGTLHLYGAGEVDNATAADADAMVGAATISLASTDSFFALGDGGAAATLVVGGDNVIYANAGIFLNDQTIITAGEAAATSLTLSTASDPVLVNGVVGIAVAKEDQSLTIDAVFADSDAGDGTLQKTGEGTLILEQADAAREVAQFAITAGTVESTQEQAFASLTSAAGTALALYGNEADLTVSEGELLGTTTAQSLTKITDGTLKVTGKMELTGALTIVDGTLGVHIDNESATIVASRVVFNNEADLKVTGYSGDGFSSTSVVIQTNSAIADDAMPRSWSVDATTVIPYDFMYGAVARSEDSTAIVITHGLYWYHEEFDDQTEQYTQAHGTFTIEAEESFLLETSLNDRGHTSLTGWDGTSLTKEGEGTLELLAASGYTGGTTVAEGTLIASAQNAIGIGAAEIEGDATLVFKYDGSVENELTGEGNVETWGELVFDADMSRHTGEVLVATGSLGLGGETSTSFTSGAAFTVANGASLNGSGQIADLLVESGGIVSLRTSDDSIKIDGDAVFEAGSFLVVGGDNALQTGGGIFLNDQTIITAGEAAATSLTLSTASDLVLVNGVVGIAVAEENQSLIIDAVFADSDDGDGTLQKTGEGTLILEQADAAREVAQFAITAGTVESTQEQTFASLTSAAGASLALYGNEADLTVSEGELLGTTFAHDLTKITEGVLQVTGKMELAGALTIEDGILGVHIDNESPTIIADSVSFSPEAKLSVTGYSGDGEYATSVVIQTNTIIRDDDMPSSWSVNDLGSIDYDFMYGGIARSESGTDIVVALGLYWYHEEFDDQTEQYTQAHGTFTIEEEESFLLETSLNDRDHASLTGWDGTSLTKEGEGTLELLAASGYTGGTTVAGGTLIASAQNAIGTGAAEIEGDATLVFKYDGSVENDLTGEGNVETRGELVFDADMSGHVGEVLVATGSLGLGVATGDIELEQDVSSFVSGAAFTVANGASLYGSGQIGDLLVESGGIVSPGYSIGSITIDGNVVFAADSIFYVEVDPLSGDSDILIVTGTADLGGAVVYHIGEGSASDYPAVGEWVILTAEGGLNGTRFADEVMGDYYLFLNETLVYPDDYTVVLHIERNRLTFSDFAVTYNQKQVAAAIDSLSGGDLYSALFALPTDADVPDLLDQLSGELHASVRGVLQSADRAFGQALMRRERGATDSRRDHFPVWAELDGFDSRGSGSGGVADARHMGLGATLGVEKCFAGSWLVGGAIRYGNSRVWVDDRHSRADIDSVSFGLHGSRTLETGPGAWRMAFAVSYGYHDIETQRHITEQIMRQRLDSGYHAHSFQAIGDLYHAFDAGDVWRIGPFARGGWNSVWSGAFTEHGGNAALKAEREHQGNFHHLIGARAEARISDRFSVDAEAGWLHTYGSNRTAGGFAFAEGGDGFVIHGISVPRDAAQVRAGLSYAVNSRMAVRIGYEAVLGKNLRSHFGNAAVEYAF